MNINNNLSESQANINSNSKSTEYNKKWYAENKATKLAYQKEKINCDICNTKIARVNMADHKKTILHNKNLELFEKNKELSNNVKKEYDSFLITKIHELETIVNELKKLLK
jgi:hypothetical protein